MKNNITITSDKFRKIKNRVHKKTYNKKKGIHENFINEFTIMSNIMLIRGIQQLGKRFIYKITKKPGNQQKITD